MNKNNTNRQYPLSYLDAQPTNEEHPLSIVTYKHMANLGDLVALLSNIQHHIVELCHRNHEHTFFLDDPSNPDAYPVKAVIYQQLDVPATYYDGAIHPTADDTGKNVMMNRAMFDMIAPLIRAQPYVHDFLPFTGRQVDYDIDVIRGTMFVNMPYGPIQRWASYAYPELQSDISKKWIYTPKIPSDGKHPITADTILINFTERYRNPQIHYFFLQEHQDRILFIGTPKEYDIFVKKWNLPNIAYLQVPDFLIAAQLIAAANVFMGNQSFLYNVAEGMKTPRMLELCAFAPNCYVTGPEGYEYLNQKGLELYFKNFA